MKLAQNVGELLPYNPNVEPEIGNIIILVFNTLILVGSAIFVLLLLIGGIQYLTAAGNEDATTKAKRMLIDSVIGLVIVLAAWAIGKWILNKFGVYGI